MRPRAILSHVAVFLSGIFIALIVSNTVNLTAIANNNSKADSNALLYSHSSRIRHINKAIDDGSEERTTSVREYDFEADSNDQHTTTALGNDSGLLGLRDRLRRNHLNSINNKEEEEEEDNNNAVSNTDICTLLPRPTPTTLSLWSSHLSHVLNATQHSADKSYEFHDFTALLLHLLSPDRLQRSVKTLPLDWTHVERCLDIIHTRLLSVQTDIDNYRVVRTTTTTTNDDKLLRPPDDVMKTINNNNKHPRKLHVLVMGGSVTMGVVCHINPVTTHTGKYSRRDCAWPGRMSTFFTNLFGGYDMIQYHIQT